MIERHWFHETHWYHGTYECRKSVHSFYCPFHTKPEPIRLSQSEIETFEIVERENIGNNHNNRSDEWRHFVCDVTVGGREGSMDERTSKLNNFNLEFPRVFRKPKSCDHFVSSPLPKNQYTVLQIFLHKLTQFNRFYSLYEFGIHESTGSKGWAQICPQTFVVNFFTS